MDVNGTKFHLLLTRDDWARCSLAGGEQLGALWQRESRGETLAWQKFAWHENGREITLQNRVFNFKAAKKDEKPRLENRRGAAADRYGNWYWIDETGLKIKISSAGSRNVSDFYPAAGKASGEREKGAFRPVAAPAPEPALLCGLAVTIDHFLVVGTIAPAGLLVFDLFAGGAPQTIEWRWETAFEPFDIAARRAGGAFVLDRRNKRFWTLDRSFQVVGAAETEAVEKIDVFQPVDQERKRKTVTEKAEEYYAELAALNDPIAIEALPDETVLILDLPIEEEDFSKVYRYFGARLVDALETRSILSKVAGGDAGSPTNRFRLRGFDFAFLEADEKNAADRLYIVSEEGNQAFPFRLACLPAPPHDSLPNDAPPLPPGVAAQNFELQPIAEYYPLRLFGGKSLARAGDRIFYGFGDRWTPLTKQNRPTFEPLGELVTEEFDGKEPNCVWHRLLLDGCLPAETNIEVYSRTAERGADLAFADWRKEPPLYLRRNGSELPFDDVKTSPEKGSGTWELLFQRAANRFLQLKLVFSGNGQRTPRVSALRVYYPRFSYLSHYLPAVYRDDEASAFFLDRFLANFEGIYTTIEDRIAAVQMLFDVRSAPAEALEWLADWLGIALDPAWTESKRRLFMSRAVDFYRYRGTLRGLRIALRLALDKCADETIFETPTAEQRRRDPVRIVERFQTRRTPEIISSETSSDQNLPRLVEQTEKWQPNQGADVLDRRYREKFKNRPPLTFPLVRPDEAGEARIWERFALEALGFVPSEAAAGDRNHWQNFLRDEYGHSLARLNQAHRTAYRYFEEVFLPRGIETAAALTGDWQAFVEQTARSARRRRLWQDFLARRYQRIAGLNEFYGTNWKAFDQVALFDRLPFFEKPAADWLQFEGAVLPMHRTAHRFTVMIPALLDGGRAESVEAQNRQLELVRRIVDLEKPAHTVFDFRFYWNLFRLDEVRLGLDTLLGLGSRDPRLNPDFVIGQSLAGESRVGIAQPERFSERYVLGTDALEKK